MTHFWDSTPCRIVGWHWRLGSTCCLHIPCHRTASKRRRHPPACTVSKLRRVSVAHTLKTYKNILFHYSHRGIGSTPALWKYARIERPHQSSTQITMGQSPSSEVPGPKLATKFTALYATRKVIIAFLKVRHLALSHSTPLSHFLNIHFNTALPSKPRSSMWPLPVRFPH